MVGQHAEFDKDLRLAIPGPARLATLDTVILELQKIARGTSTRSSLAKVALEVLRNKEIKVIETWEGFLDVDTSLLVFASVARSPVVVATVDRQLRRILSIYRIPSIGPRGRGELQISKASK